MKSTLTSVSNPRWSNAEQTTIDCEITTSRFGEEILPFTAAKNDVELHGREIFVAIVAGEFGPIAAYIPPPEPVISTPDQQPKIDGAQTL